jgi:iron complex outermembrane receptor protein
MANWKSVRSEHLRGAALLPLIVMGGGLALPSAASAADAPPAMLDEVVITARRVEENLQSAPVAVTAVSAQELQARNVTSLIDLSSLAPNVTAGSQSAGGSQNANYAIRGIGQDRSGITFDQGVGLYVDDVYRSRSDNAFLNILDVERVEVLRGPQGTLFGKNTIGGAIRYITRKPGPTSEGELDLTAGSFNRRDAKIWANVPLTDSVFLKLTFGSFVRDGHVIEATTGRDLGNEDTQVGRIQLRVKPTEKLTVDVSVDASDTKTNGRAYTVINYNRNAAWPAALRARTGQDLNSSYLTGDPYKIYGGTNNFYRYSDRNAVINAEYEVNPDLTIRSITGYLSSRVRYSNDWDGTPLITWTDMAQRKVRQVSQELQVAGTSFSDRLVWVAGVFYLEETPSELGSSLSSFSPGNPQFPIVSRSTLDLKTVSRGVFAQGVVHITDRLSSTIGLRWGEDEKTTQSTNLITGLNGANKGSWQAWSPRIGFEYKWSDDLMTYVSAARGFRSGGFNVGLAAGRPNNGILPYDPETLWSYEAGLRSDWFGRRLRVNVTGFYSDYEGMQLSALDPVLRVPRISNVGKAKIQGLEFETIAVISSAFRVYGSLGLIDAEYEELGTATNITLNSAFARTPVTNYAVGARYTSATPIGDLTASLDYNWRDDQTTTNSDVNAAHIDSYGLLSARAQLELPGEHWTIAAFATNLTDETYFIGGIDFGRAGQIGSDNRDVGRPREIGVELKFRY